MASKIFFRMSNRTFVGSPLCEYRPLTTRPYVLTLAAGSNPEYNQLNIDFTHNVFKAAILYNMLPRVIRPCVATLSGVVPIIRTDALTLPGTSPKSSTSSDRTSRRASSSSSRYSRSACASSRRLARTGPAWRCVAPTCPHRCAQTDRAQDDLLSWLIAQSDGVQRNVRGITRTLLIMNLAAVHTTTQSFTHALFHLASNPTWAHELREEIEEVVAECGWDKDALGKMRKLDSFLRESMRLNGLGSRTSLSSVHLPLC